MDEREAIRKYVEENFERAKRTRRVVLLVASVLIAAVILAKSWLFDLALANPSTGLLLISVGWMITLIIHGLITYLDSSRDGDRQIQRQLILKAKIQQRLGGLDAEIDDLLGKRHEKPKRTGPVRLSEDGELIPDDDQADLIDDETPVKRSASNNRV